MLHREFWPGKLGRSACLLLFLTASAWAQQDEPPAKPTVQGVEVNVFSTLPLPGVDLPLTEIAAPVQAVHTKDLALGLDLSDALNLRLTNVHINEIQGNPFQADLNYRGYTASPLLGTPQGISVYMDGVRLNQPFGDVVSWDLIPQIAVSSTTLMPGSNPLFGLNTLGGALAVETKSGLKNSPSNNPRFMPPAPRAPFL